MAAHTPVMGLTAIVKVGFGRAESFGARMRVAGAGSRRLRLSEVVVVRRSAGHHAMICVLAPMCQAVKP